MATGNYNDFFDSLASEHETKGYSKPDSYGVVNRLGYLGRFQMGENALIDTGYYRARDINSDKDSVNDWDGEWTGKLGINSKDSFLHNYDAQEQAVREYAAVNWGYAKAYGHTYNTHEGFRVWDGQTMNGVEITLSGILAGMHLLGIGGLIDYIKRGGITDVADDNGTRFVTYLHELSGYDTPFTVDHSKSDTLIGGSGKDQLKGWGGADSLSGAGEDDILEGGGGDDTLYGGAGSDTAVFSDKWCAYTLTREAGGAIKVAHSGGTKADGTDLLYEFETAKFSNKSVDLTGDSINCPTDFIFLVDLSGSFGDDLPHFKASAPGIANAVRESFPDAKFAVASFIDRPVSPWGGAGDYLYRPQLALTDSATSFQGAINGLTLGWGADYPEAQWVGLWRAAHGYGLNLREGSKKIVLLATDAPAHSASDYGLNASTIRAFLESEGVTVVPASAAAAAAAKTQTDSSRGGAVTHDSDTTDLLWQEVKTALDEESATPIFAVTSDVKSTYESFESNVGRGSTVTVSSDSEDLVDAVRLALAEITGTATDIGTDGNDTLTGSDDKADVLLGGPGNDSIDGRGMGDTVDGGADNDTVLGGSGSDLVRGGTGADSLDGGADSDHIEPGPGTDRMAGGAGADTFTGAPADLNGDRILDFTGEDVLRVDGVRFTAGNLTVTPGSAILNIDTDGNGSQDTTVTLEGDFPGTFQVSPSAAGGPAFTTITYNATPKTISIAALDADKAEGNAGTTAFTFTVSRSGDLSAESTVQYAVTSAAADAADFSGGLPSGIVSFAANETSITVTIDVAGDVTVEPDEAFTVTLSAPSNATLGTATAQGTIRNDDAVVLPTISIAALSADKAEGNSATTPFTFTVSRTGDASGASSVAYAVSGAADAADFGGTLPSGTVSFAANETSKTLTLNVAGDLTVEPDEAFTVTLSAPSNATLGTATAGGTIRNDDSGTDPTTIFPGTPGDDNYCGANGGDQAVGFVNDSMTGQGGDDCFSPKGGVDTVFGGSGTDLLDYSAASVVFGAPPAGAVINLASGVSTDPWGNPDYTLELENAQGTEHGDWLVGTEAANVLTGLGGADTGVGFGGNDSFDLGSGADQAYGYAGSDTILGRSGNDTLYGMEGADSLDGEADNDLLVGGADNDTLVGGAGNDSLFGESGDDQIEGGAGNDVADGGDGNDTIVQGDGANFAFAGAGNDTVTGGADADVLMGQAGNDVLTSLGGADNVLGGDGNDTLSAGEGADNVLGDAGNDSLDAGGGADVVNGGTGADQMAGGAGSDVFVLEAFLSGTTAANPDQITGFQGAGTSGSGDQDYLLLRTQSGNLAAASFTHLGAGLWQFTDGAFSTFVRILDASASPVTALLGSGYADTADFGIF